MEENIKEMFVLAKKVMGNAYAPYSKFKVGCCLRTRNNLLFSGANVEILGRPSSQCAEGAAVGSMIASGERKIDEILIVGNGELFCSPCGNCRQILAEFSSGKTLVHVCNLNGLEKTIILSKLLPYTFGKNI